MQGQANPPTPPVAIEAPLTDTIDTLLATTPAHLDIIKLMAQTSPSTKMVAGYSSLGTTW